MMLIEAMKKVKELEIKAEDLRSKVARYCADLDFETPVYGDRQKEQVAEWIQAHHDLLKEIMDLRIAVQKTNLSKEVTIDIGGKMVTHTIAEWILRRRELAIKECAMWTALTDRNLKEGAIKTSTGEAKDVKIRRYFNPVERDNNVDIFRNEPSLIDRTLEVTNAVTPILN